MIWDIDMVYTNVSLNEIYNFVIEFLTWNHLEAQIFI
jgi:hypothetical protein